MVIEMGFLRRALPCSPCVRSALPKACVFRFPLPPAYIIFLACTSSAVARPFTSHSVGSVYFYYRLPYYILTAVWTPHCSLESHLTRPWYSYDNEYEPLPEACILQTYSRLRSSQRALLHPDFVFWADWPDTKRKIFNSSRPNNASTSSTKHINSPNNQIKTVTVRTSHWPRLSAASVSLILNDIFLYIPAHKQSTNTELNRNSWGRKSSLASIDYFKSPNPMASIVSRKPVVDYFGQPAQRLQVSERFLLAAFSRFFPPHKGIPWSSRNFVCLHSCIFPWFLPSWQGPGLLFQNHVRSSNITWLYFNMDWHPYSRTTQ
jgi:hypothetical protein